MRFLVSALAICVLLLTACGGSDSHSSIEPTDAPSQTAELLDPEEQDAEPVGSYPTNDPGTSSAGANATAIAMGSLLTKNDFPADWTSEPQEPDDDEDFFTGECAVYNDDTYPGMLSDLKSDDFEGPDDQSVYSEAALFDNDEHAAEALAFVNMPETCIGQAEQAFATALEETLTQRGMSLLSSVVVTVDPLSWETVGDGTVPFRVAFSLELEQGSFSGTVDSIAWQQGPMLIGLTYTSYDPAQSGGMGVDSALVRTDEQRLVELLDYRAVHALAASR